MCPATRQKCKAKAGKIITDLCYQYIDYRIKIVTSINLCYIVILVCSQVLMHFINKLFIIFNILYSL